MLVAAVGVLVLLWGDSVYTTRAIYEAIPPSRTRVLQLSNLSGRLQYVYRTSSRPLSVKDSNRILNYGRDWPINAESILGRIVVERIPAPHPQNVFLIGIPYPLLLTGVLPLVIGAFTGFRFSLRSWLIYLTLVSVEMAYFLPNASWTWRW
jgi:hypothetical protein